MQREPGAPRYTPPFVRAHRSLAITLTCALVSACGPVHRPLRVEPPRADAPWLDAVDWPSAEAEAISLLSQYLRIDTRNPPGGEDAGATFLLDALRSAGLDGELWPLEPGRSSLVARLSTGGTEPPLCLLSHIDVATWDEGGWPEGRGPLSGVIDEVGVIWGRGALDMKVMGVIELATMLWLKRLDVPLRRDVVLLAVADEEVDNRGALDLAAQWDRIGCSHVVNEGGLGVPGVFFQDQTVFAISVAEKGYLWLRLIASGEPGHGSTPMPGRAPERLLQALDRLTERRPSVRFHPALDELFFEVGSGRTGLARAVLQRPAAVRTLLRSRLLAEPATRAMITDTVNLSGFSGARQPNVVPSEVEAVLDVRLLPGTTPDAMLAELRALVGDVPGIRFEVIGQTIANDSPWDDPFYAALRHHLIAGRTDAVAGPFVSVGFTDSIHLRPLGVRAYGIVPVEVSADLARTMHGDGERVPAVEVGRGLRRLLGAVIDFVSAPGGTPPSAPVVAPSRPRPPPASPRAVVVPEPPQPDPATP